MARIKFNNVGIKAVAACVPRNKQKTKELSYMLNDEAINGLETSTGILERRISTADICTSDLCFEAAKKLMEENNIVPDSIDMLLFMSQTSDYRIPTTSTILQNKLGLPKTTACLDLVNACSGFVYALSTAFSYASMEGINRVLLLSGDTISKVLNKNDKVSYPVFGDAGTAVLIEKGMYEPSFFELGSNGGGYDSIVIRAENGGRNSITQESLVEKLDTDGISRNDLQMKMDGMDVFSFAISTVPKSFKSVWELSEKTDNDVDLYLLHQANKYILQTVSKKLKIDIGKIPMNIDRFGNTSSASIPLLLSSEFGESTLTKKCMMCGFGAGLSWASSYIQLKDCKVSELIEL